MKIVYTDELYHMNDRHWPAGTPGGVGGQFMPSPYKTEPIRTNKYGSGYRFTSSNNSTYSARNRYQYTKTDDEGNVTVHYTPAGEKRYAYEESVNNGRSRKNKFDEDTVKDTERWIRDDYDNASSTARNIAEAARGTSNLIDAFNIPKNNPRIDLSQMTDAELNNILNRERMERTYNDYFNPPQKNKGADFVKGLAKFVAWSGEQAATAIQIARFVRSFK